jgi:hypothetical protein
MVGVRVLAGAGSFSLHDNFQTDSRAPHSLLSNGYRGLFPLGVKRPGREADHSPPSSAEVKEWVKLYLHSQYASMAWCSVKAQGQLYLYVWPWCRWENNTATSSTSVVTPRCFVTYVGTAMSVRRAPSLECDRPCFWYLCAFVLYERTADVCSWYNRSRLQAHWRNRGWVWRFERLSCQTVTGSGLYRVSVCSKNCTKYWLTVQKMYVLLNICLFGVWLLSETF